MLNLVRLIVASYSRPNLALVWILNSAARIDSKKKKIRLPDSPSSITLPVYIYVSVKHSSSDWCRKMQVHMSDMSSVELTLPFKTTIWALGDRRISTFCTMLNIASQIKFLSTMSQVREYSSIFHRDTDLPGLRRQSISHMCCIIDAALDMVHRIPLCGSGSLSSEVPV